MDWESWLEKTEPTGLTPKQLKLAKEIAEGDHEDQKDLFVKNPKVRKSWELFLEKNNAIETSHKEGEKKEEWNGKFSSSNTKDYVKDEKAQDEEEPLEELTDGKLEEVEKLKAWQVFLKGFGGVEGDVTTTTNPQEVEEKGFAYRTTKNPPKRIKGRGVGTPIQVGGKKQPRTEEQTTKPSGEVKTSQYGRPMSRELGNVSSEQAKEASKLAYFQQFGKPLGSSGHAIGSKESGRVPSPKTQEELDEEYYEKQREGHGKKQTKMSQAQLDARRKRLLGKALWEKWLEKDALTGKQSRVGSPKATENIMSEAQEVIDRDERGKRNPMYKSWLEKMQGAGDARYGNQHLTGLDQKPVNDEDDANIKAEKDKKDKKPYKVLGKE